MDFLETTKLKKNEDVEIERLKLEDLKKELILNTTQMIGILGNLPKN